MLLTNDSEVSTQPAATPAAEAAPPAQQRATAGLVINGEVIVYVALVILALVARLPELGTFPLNQSEAHEALAVWRAIEPRAAGQPISPRQPLMFAGNVLLMSIGGTDEAAPRLLTALLGAAIVLLPLLFRRWIGASRALLLAAILAASPVLFVASRAMGGAVWSLALALIGLWLFGKFVETARPSFAIAGITVAAMLILMAEPAGALMAMCVAVGIGFAVLTGDDEEGTLRRTVKDAWAALPWLHALPIAALVMGVAGTVFLLYPAALSGIGQVLAWLGHGLLNRPGGAPLVYPLAISLVYEPILWALGAAGAYLVAVEDFEGDRPLLINRFVGRLLIGWFAAGLIFSLFYAGAGPDHALWLTLPLAGLSVFAIEKILSPIRDPMWMPPSWAALIHALAMIAVLSIIVINATSVGRAFVGIETTQLAPGLTGQLPDVFLILLLTGIGTAGFILLNAVGMLRFAWAAPAIAGVVILFLIIRGAIPLLSQDLTTILPNQTGLKALMVMLASFLLVITYFLIGSIWGSGVAWRGLGLGLLLFFSAFSISAGWRTAVTAADNPADLWHINPPSRTLMNIERVIKEASLRSVGTPYDMDIVVQVPNETADDSSVAWMLRRFFKTTFVTDLSAGITARAVLAFETAEPPPLGANYVGKDFATYRTWDRTTLLLSDTIPWLYDRRTRAQPIPLERMVLYLRADVYGLDQSAAPAPAPAP